MSKEESSEQRTLNKSDSKMSSTNEDTKQTILSPVSVMTTDTKESEESLSQPTKTSTSYSATEPQFLSPRQARLLQKIGLKESSDLRPNSGRMSSRSPAARRMVSKALKE